MLSGLGRGFVARDSDLPFIVDDSPWLLLRRGVFYIVITSCWDRSCGPRCFRLSQFGSHFVGPELQTHAFRANHSWGPRQIGQNVLLKKTGIEPKAARSMFMLVEMHFPVLGQRITTMPIFSALTDFYEWGKNRVHLWHCWGS